MKKLDESKQVSLWSMLNLIQDKAMACQTYDLMIEDDKKKKRKANSKLIREFDNAWDSMKEEERHLVSLIEWWLDEAYNNGLSEGRRGK